MRWTWPIDGVTPNEPGWILRPKTFEEIVLFEDGIIEEMSDLFREWTWVYWNVESCYTFFCYLFIYLGEKDEEHEPGEDLGVDDDDDGKSIGVNCTFWVNKHTRQIVFLPFLEGILPQYNGNN